MAMDLIDAQRFKVPRAFARLADIAPKRGAHLELHFLTATDGKGNEFTTGRMVLALRWPSDKRSINSPEREYSQQGLHDAASSLLRQIGAPA